MRIAPLYAAEALMTSRTPNVHPRNRHFAHEDFQDMLDICDCNTVPGFIEHHIAYRKSIGAWQSDMYFCDREAETRVITK